MTIPCTTKTFVTSFDAEYSLLIPLHVLLGFFDDSGEGTMSQVKPRVFVSHSHSDAIFCREFVQGWRRNNIDVWYDEHNPGSGALRQVIAQELQTRDHFIVILSPTVLKSKWVDLEINGALSYLSSSYDATTSTQQSNC